jgi:translation initiation factor 1
MNAGNKIPTDGGTPLGQNPFAKLDATTGERTSDTGNRTSDTGDRKPASAEASAGAARVMAGRSAGTPETGNDESAESFRNPGLDIRNPQSPVSGLPPPSANRGRVDITRETAGRGGRTVTVVSGFVGIGQPEKEQLAKRMQKACGAGGTVKEGRIEIQGDKREQVAKILTEAGFRPVFAGG